MPKTPKSKLNDYEVSAISHEGAKNWPTYWKGDEDPIYQEYLKAVKNKEKVNVDEYFDRAIAYFKKRVEDGEDIDGLNEVPKTRFTFRRRHAPKKSRRFNRRWTRQRRSWKRLFLNRKP